MERTTIMDLLERAPADADLPPFVTQCDQDGDLQRWPRPLWHPYRCGYCGQRVGIKDFLAFYSDTEKRVSYPYKDARAVLEHRDCGPDVGYAVPLSKLLREGLDTPAGWRTHLRSKDWYHAGIGFALESAHQLAAELSGLPTIIPQDAPADVPVVPERAVTRRVRTYDPTRNPRSISVGTRTRVMERDGFRCRRCGNGPNEARLVVDHVVPVSKGGTGEESNLQVLCDPCNAGKSDREPHEHDMRGRE